MNSLRSWQHDVKALEKYPRPEGLVTPLVESAGTSEKCGLRVLSARQINLGKYKEAVAYTAKFMAEFFDTEGLYHHYSATGYPL